jgi:subtilisin family serine protease
MLSFDHFKNPYLLILIMLAILGMPHDPLMAKTVVTTGDDGCGFVVTLNKAFFVIGSQVIDKDIESLKKRNKDLGDITNPGTVKQIFDNMREFYGSANITQEQVDAQAEIEKNNALLKDLEDYKNKTAEREKNIQDKDIQDKVNQWKKEIEDFWNADGIKLGCCKVKFVVNVMVAKDYNSIPEGYDRIKIRLDPDYRSEIDGFKSGFTNGFSHEPYDHDMGGNWAWDDSSHFAKHEAGHEMGLGDQYTDYKGEDGKTYSRPNPGHESDIMATLKGKIISQPAGQEEINDVLLIFKDLALECPAKCCPSCASGQTNNSSCLTTVANLVNKAAQVYQGVKKVGEIISTTKDIINSTVPHAPAEHGGTDSFISDSLTGDQLKQIPYSQRNFNDLFNLPLSPSNNNFYLDDINKTEDHLRNNLQYFSGPSFHPPGNLNGTIKDYLSHAPQDTQLMIDKLDTLKSNPGSFYGGYNFSGFNSLRSWTVLPQELPKSYEFTPQEQTWVKNGIPFGRLGISQEDRQIKEIQQWNFELSVFENNNWESYPGYKLGESLGINGPLIAWGKTPQGPDISFYSANGNFIGDVTKAKLNADPDAIPKYLLKASFPDFFGPTMPYDRTVPVGDFDLHGVAVLPYRAFLEPNWASLEVVERELQYNEDYWDEAEDCDDDYYYFDHMEECDDYYDYADPPYTIQEIYIRHVQDKDPNNPLYPNPKPKKKKSGGGFLSGFISAIAPVGPITIGDNSGSDGVTVIDQYSLPQIGYTDLSDPNSAWNAVDTKGPNVVVAVIDSGLDLTHPDGPEFIWQNPTDGSHGWNFIDENTDLRDLRGHGTMVTGIIAARTNSGLGIAGINAGAVIMPLRVADKDGNANSLNIYRAIHYAVDHGARVINISLGSPGVSMLEKLAINYARAHNVLVVIASGNSEQDIESFGPSSSGGAIAVGALNFDGSLATVSNWGANNSIMAPGEQIFSLHSKDAPWDGPVGQRERLYSKESGTSFSAPMVAATASLLLVKNPNLTAAQLEDILLSSAKPLGKERWNGVTGAGLLDAAAALRTDPQGTFNVKITRIRVVYKDKKLDHVDVYATVRGAVDYFTVEVGMGKHAHSFRPVMGISAQEANDDLVAHIPDSKLRGSKEWVLMVRATDKSGREYEAQTALTIR